MKRELISLLLCYLSFSVFSQNYSERTLTYTQLFNEIINCKTPSYELENATIRVNTDTDKRFLIQDSSYVASLDSIRVTCDVAFDNVHFKRAPKLNNTESEDYYEAPVLQKIIFEKKVFFANVKAEFETIAHCTFKDTTATIEGVYSHLTIRDCVFERGLILNVSRFDHNLNFLRNHFAGLSDWMGLNIGGYIFFADNEVKNIGFSWSVSDRFIIIRSTFTHLLSISNVTIRSLEMESNKFLSDSTSERGLAEPLRIFDSKFEKFYFVKNSFLTNESPSYPSIGASVFSNSFKLSGTNFPDGLTLVRLDIKGSLNFGQGCSFGKGLFLDNVYFNERSTIDWHNLKNKIFMSDVKGLRSYPKALDSLESYGLLERELNNVAYCESLLKSKRTFYNTFQKQGLSRNANDVMVEIKDLETRIWENEYNYTGSANALFNWKMNEFLKTFSEYGTNPVISISYAIRVIFLFAFFYLFFHNDWDYGSNSKVRRRLELMLNYFRRNDGLSDLYETENSDKYADLEQFKMLNEHSKDSVPKLFTVIGNWFYNGTTFWHKQKSKLLKRADVLQGKWIELDENRRIKSTVFTSIWFAGTLVYAVLIKLLNALTLSVNAFTTLGFGSIPTKGIARYMVIIEGFIGWLLMTIFSVTLISQLLQ